MLVRSTGRLLFVWPLLLLGCTAAVPDISSIGSQLFLASKSPSPWEQDSPGQTLQFYGSCTSMSASFEFRVDNNSVWTAIPATPPTPQSGEYLVGTPAYDLDCSDGTFNFYVFMSQVDENVTSLFSPSAPPSNYEPGLVEIRTLQADSSPTPGSIVYQRPSPAGFRLNSYSSGQWWMGLMERNQPVKFEISLISSTGSEVRAYPNSVNLVLTAQILSGTGTGVGSFFDSDCATPITAALLEFTTTGDRRKVFCYIPNDVDPGVRIQLTGSASGLSSVAYEANITAINSVINDLSSFHGFQQDFPRTLIKGATYRLRGSLRTFDNYSLSRSVSGFSGSFLIHAGSSAVVLQRIGSDAQCPATSQTSSMTCTSTGRTQVPFELQVGSESAAQSLELQLTSTPDGSCSNCQIQYTPSPIVSISSYHSSTTNFQLVSGPLAYHHPVLNTEGDRLKQYQCRRFKLSLANTNGHTLPAPNQAPTLHLVGPAGLEFFQDGSCSGLTLGFNAAVDKMVLRPDGKLLVTGPFSSYNGQIRNRLAVINPDGTLDPSFTGPALYPSGAIFDLLPLPDGRTLVAGSFTDFAVNSSNNNNLVMLNESGQVDPSFHFSPNGTVYSLALDPNNGRIYVGGSFTNLFIAGQGTISRANLFGLDPNGSGFLANIWYPFYSYPVGSSIFKVMVSGNALYLGGNFASIGAQAVNNLARINISGQVLETWPTGFSGPNGDVYSLEQDVSTGRIFVGGNFANIVGSGQTRPSLAVFTNAGLLDSMSFASLDGSVYDMKVVNNDIYLSGDFTLVNGAVSRRGMMKLNHVTSALDTWNPQSNNVGLMKMAVSYEGVYMAGPFTSLNATSVSNFAKVNLASGAAYQDFNVNQSPIFSLSFSPYDLIKTVYVRASGSLLGAFNVTVSDGSNTYSTSMSAEP